MIPLFINASAAASEFTASTLPLVDERLRCGLDNEKLAFTYLHENWVGFTRSIALTQSHDFIQTHGTLQRKLHRRSQ